MAATTQPKTFVDLYTALLNRVREQTSVTATSNQAKMYINIGLQDMHIGYGERFPWAERRGRITTQAPYITGTVSINQGSSTLTGLGTLWNTANAFGVTNTRKTGRIVINGSSTIYDLTSVNSDTGITLSSPFVEANVSGGTYLYFEDEYALDADFLRPLDMQFFDYQRGIRIIDRLRFRREHTRNNITTGKPMQACIVDRAFDGNATPVRHVQFWQPPSLNYSIPYAFVTNKLAVSTAGVAQESLSADTDEPIVPLQFRNTIVIHALYNWYRDKKDDVRSGEVKSEYVDAMLRITGDTEIGERRPYIQPAMGGYRRRASAPYRMGRSSKYRLGDAFDQMRED